MKAWSLGVLLVTLASSLDAQPAAPARPGAPATAAAPDAAAEQVPRDYVVGPGDLLAIQVFGVTDFGQAARVSNSGKIHVDKLGIIPVAGKTVAQLESELAAKLRDRGLMRDPWVLVKVTEYRAYPVYLLGEIMTPGQFVLTKEMTLRDLLVLGQGFNKVASPVGFLYRLNAGPPAPTGQLGDAAPQPAQTPEPEVIRIDFRELESNPEANLRLKPGDVLYCPERRRTYYFVVGDVLTPGLFEMGDPVYDETNNVGDQAPLKLSQALARAGGPAKTAKLGKALLVRYGENGTRQEIPVDLEQVFKGTQPDLAIQLNDIIFVPGSVFKTIGYGLLGALPGVTGQVVGATR